MTFNLLSYKHSVKPQGLSLSPEPELLICPVYNLLLYLAVRPKVGLTLFVDRKGTPVNRCFVARHLKDLLAAVGENPQEFNTHSLRVGRATDLALAGSSDAIIRQTGRWKSNAYLGYVRFNLFHLPAV